jgi:single-strand DNA-binding protein
MPTEPGRPSRHECRFGSVANIQLQEDQLSDIITLTGIVGTEPRAVTTHEGLAITSFRLASTQRRFDRAKEKWVDGETNWYTITTFRQLATNSAVSVKKGEHVLVTGRLRIREWENGGKTGTNIDIEAEAIGHDLSWGTTVVARGTGSNAADTAGGAGGAGSAGGAGGAGAMDALAGAAATFPSEADLAEIEVASDGDLATPF